jgi:hypothetical protein
VSPFKGGAAVSILEHWLFKTGHLAFGWRAWLRNRAPEFARSDWPAISRLIGLVRGVFADGFGSEIPANSAVLRPNHRGKPMT